MLFREVFLIKKNNNFLKKRFKKTTGSFTNSGIMKATQQEMADNLVPLHVRDNCAHILIPLNKYIVITIDDHIINLEINLQVQKGKAILTLGM
jgi:hypothetical protein